MKAQFTISIINSTMFALSKAFAVLLAACLRKQRNRFMYFDLLMT